MLSSMGESDATSAQTHDLTFEGDRELASQAQNLLAKTCPAAAVARITPTAVTYATRNATQDSVFEIGSVTKGITGMLYHEALTRQEITTDSTLGDFLPLAGSKAANVTLASITTHRSGLPRLLKTRGHLGRMLAYAFRGKNPYQDSLETTIQSARKARLKTPKPTYSNWAFDLLGHSLAAAAGTNYRELVLERIAKPLKLESICLPYDLSEWPNQGVQPCDKDGDPYEPWTGEASRPCGGIAANIVDLATLARAILDGTAPGAQRLTPLKTSPTRTPALGLAGSPQSRTAAASHGTTAELAAACRGSAWIVQHTRLLLSWPQLTPMSQPLDLLSS